jgi:hypothetical protein
VTGGGASTLLGVRVGALRSIAAGASVGPTAPPPRAEPSAVAATLPDGKLEDHAPVDTIGATDVSQDDGDERRGWVGMRGWYY